MFEKELQSMGLTEGEAKVYEALLFLGSSTVGPIVNRSKVSYSNIYEILDRLTVKGLVSYVIKEKTKRFQAADPSRINDYLDSQELKITRNKEILKSLVPFLNDVRKASGKTEEVEMFIGNKGLMTAYEVLLHGTKKGDEAFFFYAYNPAYMEISLSFYRRIMPFFKEIGIRWNGITQESYRKISLARQIPKYIIKERYVGFPVPGNVGIFNDRILIIAWSSQPIGIVIHSKEVADNFKSYFSSLWEMAKD
jgi:predicted transcriptional regulator